MKPSDKLQLKGGRGWLRRVVRHSLSTLKSESLLLFNALNVFLHFIQRIWSRPDLQCRKFRLRFLMGVLKFRMFCLKRRQFFRTIHLRLRLFNTRRKLIPYFRRVRASNDEIVEISEMFNKLHKLLLARAEQLK